VSNLVNRILVAVPLAAVALGAAWQGGLAMLALGLVVALLGLHELFRMTRSLRPTPLTGHLGGVALLVVAYEWGIQWTPAVIGGVLVATFVVAAAVSARESALVTLAVTVFGVIWIGYGVAYLILLRGAPDPTADHVGFKLVLAVFIVVWLSDIFAYFGGRLVGRRRLAPAISPNKTVEGFVIGLIFGAFGGWVTLYNNPFESGRAFAIALAAALAGPLGDLFESFIKRDAGVKDSGTLLGGHGGVLDRVDALLFASAAAYFVWLGTGG
jgi:phosphatidate cytidylyltransferase